MANDSGVVETAVVQDTWLDRSWETRGAEELRVSQGGYEHGNPVISNLRKVQPIPTGYIYWV